jgi:hypothetical protein
MGEDGWTLALLKVCLRLGQSLPHPAGTAFGYKISARLSLFGGKTTLPAPPGYQHGAAVEANEAPIFDNHLGMRAMER